jgi:hypothetical protein
MIFEASMNFNPRAAFVAEKLEHIALFNHENNALWWDRWDDHAVICADIQKITRSSANNKLRI